MIVGKASKKQLNILKKPKEMLDRPAILLTHLIRHLYDSASYKKRVTLDCLFDTLKYDLCISEIGEKSTSEFGMRYKQVQERRQKLMVNLASTHKLDMNC